MVEIVNETEVPKMRRYAQGIRDLAADRKNWDGKEEIVVVEIAGRDSFAALSAYLRTEIAKRSKILPTVLTHQAETFDLKYIEKSLAYLNEICVEFDVILLEPLIFDITDEFSSLILQTMGIAQKNSGFFSPCPPCHFLLHALRVPIARAVKSETVISGERILHDSREKINQYASILRYFKEFMKSFGIRLEQPLLNISDTNDLELSRPWRLESMSPGCMFSKNYYDEDGQPLFKESDILNQLRIFYEPRFKKLIKNYLRD